MTIEMKNIEIKIADKCIVRNININVPNKKFVGIVGLNGTGKSTILKAAYGINKYNGEILIDGINIKNIKTKELAKKIAVLIQENNNEFDFKVEDMVMLGRLPYKDLFGFYTAQDKKIVTNALKYVEMENYKNRYFNSLSGGEKQRVLIARILAQECKNLILDEPTNHLDVKNQFKLFETIKKLDFTVLAVLHDLNIAAKFCDYIYILNNGSIQKEGKPLEVFDKNTLENIFGMRAEIKNNFNSINIEYIHSI